MANSTKRFHRTAPQGGCLRPRLLQGAGEGGLLDSGAVEAAEGICGGAWLRGGAGICGRGNGQATGRAAFGEMVAYLKAHPAMRVILVEKTDRLYRNLKDWVTVDELDVEIHFPKEGVVLSRESRSSEKFMHGIKVLMAKNYIDNLSEEARKGMQEKAEQGIWPTKTPLGYRNITGPDGKKIIAVDPALAPIVAEDVRVVCHRPHFVRRKRRKRPRRRAWLYPQERRKGAGEHGAHHPAQSALHGLVRMERQAHSGQARAARFSRTLGAGAGCAGRPLRQEAPSAASTICVLGPDRLPCLRLRRGRRDQEAALHLLSLHRLCR